MATYIELTEIKTSRGKDISNNIRDKRFNFKKQDMVRHDKILKKGIQVKIEILGERDELERAMVERNPDIVKRLIKDGAPIDLIKWDRNDEMITPIIFAMKFQRMDIFTMVLERILKEGMDLKKRFLVKTAMLRACIKNLLPFAHMLLRTNKHIDFTKPFVYGDHQRGLEGKLKNLYDATEVSYLHFCAIFGSSEVLGLLLEEKFGIRVDINQKDSKGNTALHLATGSGYSNCANALLKYGANINEMNEDGSTPLIIAIKYSSVELVFNLICAGADVNAIDFKGSSPILTAANRGREELIHILIMYGANVNMKNLSYKTALMFACEAGNVSSVKELLYNGALVDCTDENGIDAFTCAMEKNQDQALSLIIKAYRKVENFKNLEWHKVLNKKLCKSILTMLDCLIQPEVEKNRVKVDFTILEMDAKQVTPGDMDKYDNKGRRKPYLFQLFASNNNEDIAYHPVTRLLVDRKFQQYGNIFLWFKTLLFISFLVAMLYSLVQAAQERQTTQDLYNEVHSIWDIFRYVCEIYVVLFWLGNVIAELAEIVQVIIYARREFLYKQKKENSYFQNDHEQEKNQQQKDKILKEIDEEYTEPSKLTQDGLYTITPDLYLEEPYISKEYPPSPSDHLQNMEIETETDKSDGVKCMGNDESDKFSTHGTKLRENYIQKKKMSGSTAFDSEDQTDESFLESILDHDYFVKIRENCHCKIIEKDVEKKTSREKRLPIKRVIDLRKNFILYVLNDYFYDLYNILDLAGIIFLLILIVFRIIILANPYTRYVEFHWVFATFAFAVNSLRLTKLLSVFNVFGTYLRIVIIILWKDVPKFVGLLTLTSVYFTTILFLSFRVPLIIGEGNNTVSYYTTLFDLPNIREDGLINYVNLFLYSIRIILEGNTLEFNYLYNSFTFIASVTYITFQFFIIVVYINVFIAQLTDTFAEVKANAKKTVAKYRLEFIVQLQTTSLLALCIDFRKRFYEEHWILEAGKWSDYFDGCISRMEDEFATQEPSENLHLILNKLKSQQKLSSRSQDILQAMIERRVKNQQSDIYDIKTVMADLRDQNASILKKLNQIEQSEFISAV